MTGLACPSVPVSWGELLDKITILAIKRDRIADAAAKANVLREHDLLARIGAEALHHESITALVGVLGQVNAELWDIEDAIRRKEARGQFDPEFIGLARSVYLRNDERARIKREINQRLGSELVEEKSYASVVRVEAGQEQPIDTTVR